VAQESRFKARIINHLKKLGYYTQTIESTTGRGIPDIYICGRGIGAWIEVKAPTHNKVTLRPEQRVWLNIVGIKHKIPCFVLAEHQNTGKISVSFPHNYKDSMDIDIKELGTFDTTSDTCKFLCLHLTELSQQFRFSQKLVKQLKKSQ